MGMKIFKGTVHICLAAALGLALFCPRSVWAGENAGADFLVELGERDLKKGNVKQAIHEFSKALMLDPGHEKALAYMREYGFEEGLYSGTVNRLSEAGDFARKIKTARDAAVEKDVELVQIRTALDKVKAHRDQLSRELTGKSLKLHDLQTQTGKLKAEMEVRDRRFEDQVSQLEELYAAIEQDMAKVRERETDSRGMTRGASDRLHAYENELIALQQEYNLLREKEHQHRERQRILHEQLEDYVYVRNRIIDDLSDELIYKDLDAALKQSRVLAGLERVDHLDQLIEDHRRQIAGQYDAIEDQKKDIEYLKNQLAR
jgi:chromosome segregation ATPase